MASPDVAAADLALEWRGRPIPRTGDHIKVVALVSSDAGYFMVEAEASGLVARVTLDPGLRAHRSELMIQFVGDPQEYLLREHYDKCDWALIKAASNVDPESPPAALPAVDLDAMSIVALERRLLAIKTRLAAIDGEEEALNAEAATLNRLIRETALAEEMDSLPGVDGMSAYFCPVYHIERKVDESTGKQYTTADLMAALRESGHAYLIKEAANGNQVRALAREIIVDNERPLPPPLAKVIKLVTDYDVRFTPMGATKRRAAPQRDD